MHNNLCTGTFSSEAEPTHSTKWLTKSTDFKITEEKSMMLDQVERTVPWVHRQEVELDWKKLLQLKVLTSFQTDSSLDRRSAFRFLLRVSLCLLEMHYTHIIKLLQCGSRSVKSGPGGWLHLKASATFYQPSGSKRNINHEKHFGGI